MSIEWERRPGSSTKLASIESSRSEPEAVVGRAYARHWARNYDREDPRYVGTVEEEIAFVNGTTAAKLRELHSGFLGATGAEVVVIGDFDPNDVRSLIAERLDGWRSPKPFDDVLNLYANLATDTTTQDFDTPDKENAFFLGGMPIEMRDSHPDYPALVIGNYILGSSPASRLFARIRGAEGLSYGVGSGFSASPRSDAAQFTVNAIAAPQNMDKVEESFREFLLRFRRDIGRPMTEAEHSLARAAHCSGFVDGTDAAFSIAEAMAANAVEGGR